MPLYHHKITENQNVFSTSGFDEFGHPVNYRSSIKAGCRFPIPNSGLVFYASFNGNTPGTAETGQSLSTYGSISYIKDGGIPCAYFGGSSYIYYPYSSGALPSGSSPCTMSIWAKDTVNSGGALIGYGAPDVDNNNHRQIMLTPTWGIFLSNNSEGYVREPATSFDNNWHHYCIVVNEKVGNYNNIQIFTDGILTKYGNLIITTDTYGNLVFGTSAWDIGTWSLLKGYLAAARIYNRVLTQLEIKALCNEFNPID